MAIVFRCRLSFCERDQKLSLQRKTITPPLENLKTTVQEADEAEGEDGEADDAPPVHQSESSNETAEDNDSSDDEVELVSPVPDAVAVELKLPPVVPSSAVLETISQPQAVRPVSNPSRREYAMIGSQVVHKQQCLNLLMVDHYWKLPVGRQLKFRFRALAGLRVEDTLGTGVHIGRCYQYSYISARTLHVGFAEVLEIRKRAGKKSYPRQSVLRTDNTARLVVWPLQETEGKTWRRQSPDTVH